MISSAQIGSWYALAVNAGQERRIRERILDRLERRGVSDPSLSIVAPEEEVVVRSGGEATKRRRMSLPGYLLVYGRQLREETLGEMPRVKGVLGFLGGNECPTPLPQYEIDKLLGTASNDGVRRVKTQSLFSVGDRVTIVDGPFADFTGIIAELNEDKGTARVEIEIFGRKTPAEVQVRSLSRG